MEDRTKGAWIINHAKRLMDVRNVHDFEEIESAGKCGIFLSNLAASDEQSEISEEKVLAIAKASDIKKTEIETIKQRLKSARLIDTGKTGSIAVLGITTASVLCHTASLFEASEPSAMQKAAIDLSESVSDQPTSGNVLSESICDTHKLSRQDMGDLLLQSEEIGFIDYEAIEPKTKLYFNGNLFRREDAKKASLVLASLTQNDRSRIIELDDLLKISGCVLADKGRTILGETLFSKLISIGMYDLNDVSNPQESKTFITKPSSFSKFGNPFEEDALDLAKAFVASLHYGMTFSSSGRGKITQLSALLRKLIAGYEVGPASAIGEDYRILELRRVIQIRQETGTKRYFMKLLKKDIGQLAMQVLQMGDTAEQTLVTANIYTGSVTNYVGPESNRSIHRKRQNSQSKKSIADLLRTFRG